jgi:hypothetical protein
MISLTDLRCACGTPDKPMCFDPGEADVREMFLLKRERPVVGRCLRCLIGEPATAEVAQ